MKKILLTIFSLVIGVFFIPAQIHFQYLHSSVGIFVYADDDDDDDDDGGGGGDTPDGYSQGSYYSEGYYQGGYYGQGGYYSEGGYYSQGDYYSQGYYQGSYYSQGSYYDQGYYQGYYQASYYSQGSYYSEATYCSVNAGEVCSSGANSCGMTSTDYYDCDGICPAVTPEDSSCSVPETTTSSGYSGGSGFFSSFFIPRGGICRIEWESEDSTDCSLKDAGGSEVDSGTSGTYLSPPLNQTTIYNLYCENGSEVSATTRITCRVNPLFKEI